MAIMTACLTMAGLTWADDETGPVRQVMKPFPRQMENYARNCQGCHGSSGVTVKEIPPLLDRIGYFTRAPEGRVYLVQVPNVALSVLNDEELAEMLNWMLLTYSAKQLPKNFRPYSAAEVGDLRKVRINPAVRRPEIVNLLAERGLVPDSEALRFPAPDLP